MTNSAPKSCTRLAALLLALTPLAAGCATEVETEEAEGVDSRELVSECEVGEARSCDIAGEPELSGVQYCDPGTFVASWSECEISDEPPPPETCPEGTQLSGGCCVDMATGCCIDSWEECNTPLLLAFDNERVQYTSAINGSFDLTGYGVSVANDWPTVWDTLGHAGISKFRLTSL